MKIQYSPYSLIKKSNVNAFDKSPRQEGTLIRLVKDGDWGVADISPWPSLGDIPLVQEIEQKGTLFQRALQLAEEDLQARVQKKSLLQDRWVDNNILITDYHHFDFSNPIYKTKTLKIKGDKQVEKLAAILNQAPSYLIFRIDFNAVLSAQEFQKFLDSLSTAAQIEYIEDPSAYDVLCWSKWNTHIPLARDFVRAPSSFTYQVVKPVREALPKEGRFTITSAMDHAVGVAHALRYAQTSAQSKSGLLTLDLYQETPFHSYFIYRNESEINFHAKALNDFGIGMTEDLNRLQWKDSL
jgi:hypothetical protein